MSAAPVAQMVPQDVDAEMAVLGGIFLSPGTFVEVRDALEAADFSHPRHAVIFASMARLHERGTGIDILTVAEDLRQTGELHDAGGPAYLAELDANVPATGNSARYAEIVRDRSIRRALMVAGLDIGRAARNPVGSTADVLDDAERKVLAIRDRGMATSVEPIAAALPGLMRDLEARFHAGNSITGVPTGYEALDGITAGLHPGDLVIVAGRPSMGKTSLALNVATNVARIGRPVAIFSLEMSRDALLERVLSLESRVPLARIRNGQFLGEDWPRMAATLGALHHLPIVIRDRSVATLGEVRAAARRVRAKYRDIGLVVIDYLQLMHGREDADNREQVISEISRGLKALAMELKVPVMALSQLNRSLERRNDKRPMLSDLRESGAIEQDADLVAFVYRDEVYNKESPDKGVAEVIIGKQRQGAVGTVRLAFTGELTRFDTLREDYSNAR